ncbi:uncharacterized protein VTP21DRAFT_9983 [Calcarisporiella thermophila]|uniref:uncharacterized protein n=1 Tax=Calcarisporiella thermophila TaxID=911321 RepID=UPI0037426FA7
MLARSENSFFRKTRNAIVKHVRERYIRDDIPCLSKCCPELPPCYKRLPTESGVLSPDAIHYIIPDISVAGRYSEILEYEELKNIIITQTVIERLLQYDKHRTCRRLRQLVSEPQKHTVLFSNENFAHTHIERFPGEEIKNRDWRAICKVASWYRLHLRNQIPIIILSEQFQQADLTLVGETPGIHVYSLPDYLSEFWPQHSTLHNLMDSLKDAIFEEDLGVIKIGGKANEKGAATDFEEYKTTEELESGIKSGRYHQGILRVNSNHRDEALVNCGSRLGSDIIIIGNQNRNRAVHGDLVVVELLSERLKATGVTQISYEMHSAQGVDDSEEAISWDSTESLPTGRVVGILSRNWRAYVATIQEDDIEQGGSFHLAVPLLSIIPKVRIRHRNVNSIVGQRIVVRIDSWPANSQYPNGHYVRSLGPIHQLDTEIQAILVEHEIGVSQAISGFSEASLREMPVDTEETPWLPDQDEVERRRDLRSTHLIFSIDPPNCQDIDDALSIRELEGGVIELGVHIADVSFFVHENSNTDLEARSRGTTVYLADRRFDMLPSVLSERVCSLRGNRDRYAVSVIWNMDQEGRILETWFGRTVIRSAREMEYREAQLLLDDKDVDGIAPDLAQRLRKSIKQLSNILTKIRKRRFEKGALELESTEVEFKFTTEHGIADITPKQPLLVHKLVEEAMVLANASVAYRIYSGLHDSALLRRHPPPIRSHFRRLELAAQSRGIEFDVSSNKALAESLARCAVSSAGDKEFVWLLKSMATMAMSEAGYISSGAYGVEEYRHYGLALDFYTHFTSPIRRYADLVVHRQLLDCERQGNSDTNTLGQRHQSARLNELCNHLNRKTRESKFAQKDSTELFQALYVLQQSKIGPVVESGIISEIRENGFLVYVPRFGIKGPVYIKDKDGNVIVPQSIISGKLEDESTFLEDLQVAHSPNAIQLHIGGRVVQLRLFDHVRLSLKLHLSHAHRHTVYMVLLGIEERKITRQHQQEIKEIKGKLTEREMRETIIGGEKGDINLDHARSVEKLEESREKDNMYEILERFGQMSIVEVDEAVK